MIDGKYEVAKRAVIKWMGRTGMTSDPRFTYAQLIEYANELAMALVAGQGTRSAIVNGMELISTPFGDYVIYRGGNA